MEGPSLVILREALNPYKSKTVVAASGIAKIDYARLTGQKIKSFKSWGKHFLVVFKGCFIRIHFLMFGSYRINEEKQGRLMLSLTLDDGSALNFYACAIRLTEGDPEDVYDWRVDVMHKEWNATRARRTLKKQPDRSVSDALLDQDIFAGVGNIIKNEVLFRISVHPESTIGALPPRKLTQLINEARQYSFDFYRWKKKFELKKHWLIYTKRKCPQCKLPVVKKPTGKNKRRSFYCLHCQTLYQ